jgi:hypothetical protein
MAAQTELPLSAIKIDEELQHRALDEPTLEHYCELMRDGVQFPPIEVITDGKNIWVTDGFHRVECHKKLKLKKIKAVAKKGDRRDALWESFAANKLHGLPRPPGTAEKIIRVVLSDSKWARTSQSKIADHIGISQQYVSQIKDKMLAEQKQAKKSSGKKAGKISTSGSESPEEQISTSGSESPDDGELQRDSEIDVTTKDGKSYTRKSGEKQNKAAVDGPGKEIPEKLMPTWEHRATIAGYMSTLRKVRDAVMKHFDSQDGVMDMLNETAFKAMYTNLRRELKAAQPYAVCPYCGGRATRCKACKKRGFLNEYDYRTVPAEYKK